MAFSGFLKFFPSGKDSVPGIRTNYPSAENAAALYIIPGRGFRRKNILNRCPKSFEYKLLGNQKHRLYLVPLIAVYPLGIDRHKWISILLKRDYSSVVSSVVSSVASSVTAASLFSFSAFSALKASSSARSASVSSFLLFS